MKNNNNNNSVKLAAYLNSYITAGVLFGIIYILSMILFGLVTEQASGVMLYFISGAAYISAFIIAGITAVRCAKANKIKNPDIFTSPRDTAYYFKRVAFIAIMIILMNLAASLVGMFANAILASVFLRIENIFLREFFIKLPVFILYIIFVYKMLVRYGFMDSQRKIFNKNIKTLAFIIALLVLLPSLVYDNYFYSPTFSNESLAVVNVQTILSPAEGSYIFEYDGMIENENFGVLNIILIGLSVLATFIIQIFIFRFAYNKGKKIFIKQHIREVGEYETDENI